jgi:hypothetical protein
LLQKVLLKKRNNKQVLGASIGTLAGLFLLLFALQVYLDVQILTKGAKDDNFLMINKQFERYLGKPKSFSAEELNHIKQQPFLERVEAFEATDCQVMLSSQQMGFQTLLFFQSIPSDFLGIDTSTFVWKKGDKLPIVLSQDYLALYNYGFAPSQGLPPFSANTISYVDFTVTISSSKGQESFTAYVNGFTPNVNSILVPEEFLAYANGKYGMSSAPEKLLPTQLMASTNNPYSLELEHFLEEKGYEISRGGLIGGELKSTLYLLVFLILIIGVIIIGLALLVFTLNFQVLVAKASQDIQLLLQLGYTNHSITQVLSSRFVKLFILIIGAVFLLLFLTKYTLSQDIISNGYPISAYVHWGVWVAGVLLTTLFIGLNLWSIRKSVERLG